MIKKLTVAVVVVVFMSLLVAGCTGPNNPSPTPSQITVTPSRTTPTPSQTPPAPSQAPFPTPTSKPTYEPTKTTRTPVTDYSRVLDQQWGRGAYVLVYPFAKSTNDRGNDVYTGIVRRSELPAGSGGVTCVITLSKTKTDAHRLFSEAVAKRQSEGFVYDADFTAKLSSGEGKLTPEQAWAGSLGEQQAVIYYRYDPAVSSWEVVTLT